MFLAGAIGSAGAVVGLLNARAQQFSNATSVSEMFPSDESAATGAPIGPHQMKGWSHAGAEGTDPLALVYDAPDKQLTVADVQKIAEAFLLWRGNHFWRVSNLAMDGDRVVFSVVTAQNAVVASFAINRHTGVLLRTG